MLKSVIFLTLSFSFVFYADAQRVVSERDTLRRQENFSKDSLFLPDTLSLKEVTEEDTLGIKPGKNAIDFPIDYKAQDSTMFSPNRKRAYLYKNAEVKYQDITLKADYIELDMEKRMVIAKGIEDSTGKLQGIPVFSQGSQTYRSKELKYNFKTQKGFMRELYTEQEGGYLHGEQTKKLDDGSYLVKRGKYTTCELDHPHYYFHLTKAKTIPKDKTVSGPAWLVIEDVPIPAPIPFGMFPNKMERSSGILIPAYGEERNRGFFLRNGGFYWAINEYLDMKITGDIYSRGTWGIRNTTSYKLRYKFSGNMNFSWYNNVTGEEGLEDYSRRTDYNIVWSHRKDPKSNPNSSFTANVNISTSTFDENHSYRTTDYLTGQKSSSISYSKTWPNSPFNFSMGLNHSQNNQTGIMNLTMPRLAFNMNRVYPFKSKNRTGNAKWYESIQLSYSSKMENRFSTADTSLFDPSGWKDIKNGFQHEIPLSASFKALNNLMTISPQVKYTGVLYSQYLNREYYDYYYNPQSHNYGKLMEDTIRKLKYAHAYTPSVNVSLNPKVTGYFTFVNKNSETRAIIRHVMSPSISLNLAPDMSDYVPDYYDTYIQTVNGEEREVEYSIFEGGLYGTPTVKGRSGSLSFSLKNNFEMKVKDSKDTITGMRKVKLLDNLSFNTNYDIFRDSLNWSPITISGNTRLFNAMSINLTGSLDPYAIDSVPSLSGNSKQLARINTSEWARNRKIGRLTKLGISADLNLKSAQKGKSDKQNMVDEYSNNPVDENDFFNDDYVDFSVPWNVRLRYSFTYSKPYDTKTITQTLSFSGDVSLTPKWKIGFTSGYDFKQKDVSYTTFNIARDLHCWDMRLTVVPFGNRQSYFFKINVKSTMLKDLQLEKRQSWQDKVL